MQLQLFDEHVRLSRKLAHEHFFEGTVFFPICLRLMHLWAQGLIAREIISYKNNCTLLEVPHS